MFTSGLWMEKRAMRFAMAGLAAAWISTAGVIGRATAEQVEEPVKVFNTVQASVVLLQNAEGHGTGIVLSKGGRILTNAHVVSSPLPFHCTIDLRKGKDATERVVFKQVKIIGYHPTLDLALVEIDPNEHKGAGTLEPAKFVKQKASPGQHVYVIGNPSGAGMALTKTITDGILSGVDRVIDGNSLYQTSAPINPGNSGGPLCDREGRVIAVVTLKANDKENIGFAIPTYDLTYDNFVQFEKRHSNPERAKEIINFAALVQDHAMKLRALKGSKDMQVREELSYAAHYYHLALLEDPTNDSIYYQMGSLLSALEYEKVNEIATAYLMQAIRMNPWGGERGRYYAELGDMFAKVKRPTEARIIWEEGVAKFPKSAGPVWASLAKLDAGEKKSATAAYRAAVALRLASSDLIEVRHVYEDQRKQLAPSDQEKLDDDESKMDDALESLQDAADKRKTANDKFVNKDCVAVLEMRDFSELDKPAAGKSDGKSAADAKKPGAVADSAANPELIEFPDGTTASIEFPAGFQHTGKSPEASTPAPMPADPAAGLQQSDTIKIEVKKLEAGVNFPDIKRQVMATETQNAAGGKVIDRGSCTIAGQTGDYIVVGIGQAGGLTRGGGGKSDNEATRKRIVYVANVAPKHLAVKITAEMSDANYKTLKEELKKCLRSLKFD